MRMAVALLLALFSSSVLAQEQNPQQELIVRSVVYAAADAQNYLKSLVRVSVTVTMTPQYPGAGAFCDDKYQWKLEYKAEVFLPDEFKKLPYVSLGSMHLSSKSEEINKVFFAASGHTSIYMARSGEVNADLTPPWNSTLAQVELLVWNDGDIPAATIKVPICSETLKKGS